MLQVASDLGKDLPENLLPLSQGPRRHALEELGRRHNRHRGHAREVHLGTDRQLAREEERQRAVRVRHRKGQVETRLEQIRQVQQASHRRQLEAVKLCRALHKYLQAGVAAAQRYVHGHHHGALQRALHVHVGNFATADNREATVPRHLVGLHRLLQYLLD